MPDLSAEAVNTWLNHTDPNPISELPYALRRAELEPSVETALVALGIALDDTEARGPRRLSKRLQTDPARSTFQTVLAQLGSARLLRLLDWLSEPGKSSRHSLLTALSRLAQATPHRPSSLPSNFSTGALLSIA